MSDDPIKAADKLGYARGYAAGRRRVRSDRSAENQRKHDEARRDRFFCAALNGLLPTAGWQMGGKDMSSLNDYVELAARFADQSLRNLRRRSLP